MILVRRPLYHHPMWFMTNNEFPCSESKCQKTFWKKSPSCAIHANDEKVTFSLDLPGVKPSNVQVQVDTEDPHSSTLKVTAERNQHGTEEKVVFSREWAVDPSVVDLSSLKAHMVDGVLTMQTLKKKHVSKKIKVVSGDAPDLTEGGELLSTTMDLPGVNASNVDVSYKNGQILVKALRKIGSGTSSVNRVVSVDEHTIDLESFEAFLVDGVLTLTASRVEAQPGQVTTISVSSTPLQIEQQEVEEAGAVKESDIAVEATSDSSQQTVESQKEWVDVETVAEEDDN